MFETHLFFVPKTVSPLFCSKAAHWRGKRTLFLSLLAVAATGAYCRAMASNYNHVPRPPVIAVNDGLGKKVTLGMFDSAIKAVTR